MDRPPSDGRACPAPDQRNQTPPLFPETLRPVQTSPSRFRSFIVPRPKPARRSSTTDTSAGPSTASMRRSSTARSGSAGIAMASRHSILPSPTQRLRQISVPAS